jgi:hypothetical protein
MNKIEFYKQLAFSQKKQYCVNCGDVMTALNQYTHGVCIVCCGEDATKAKQIAERRKSGK